MSVYFMLVCGFVCVCMSVCLSVCLPLSMSVSVCVYNGMSAFHYVCLFYSCNLTFRCVTCLFFFSSASVVSLLVFPHYLFSLFPLSFPFFFCPYITWIYLIFYYYYYFFIWFTSGVVRLGQVRLGQVRYIASYCCERSSPVTSPFELVVEINRYPGTQSHCDTRVSPPQVSFGTRFGGMNSWVSCVPTALVWDRTRDSVFVVRLDNYCTTETNVLLS